MYDYKYEADEIVLIQALLLMTFWHENPEEHDHSWPWMKAAIALCENVGLNYTMKRSDIDPKMARLRKRIWWSCLIRDRIIALGTRHPMIIDSRDNHVSILTLDDFAMAPIPNDIRCISPSSPARDIEKQKQLAIMCVKMAQLCSCIGNVLKIQYHIPSGFEGRSVPRHNISTTKTLLPRRLVPRKQPRKPSEVKQCDTELTSWLGALSEQGLHWQNITYDSLDRGGSLVVHRALLYLVYLTTLGTLHRPQVLSLRQAPLGSFHNKLYKASMEKVRFAATEVTRLGKELQILDLVQCSPATLIIALFPAMVNHLLDIKSVDRRHLGLEGLYTCMTVLQVLRKTYGCADVAIEFLDVAIQRTNTLILPPGMSLLNTATQAIGLIKHASVSTIPELNPHSLQITDLQSPKIPAIPVISRHFDDTFEQWVDFGDAYSEIGFDTDLLGDLSYGLGSG